jgi:hypothetical protein
MAVEIIGSNVHINPKIGSIFTLKMSLCSLNKYRGMRPVTLSPPTLIADSA